MAILNFKYGTGTPSTYEQGTVYVSTDNKKIYIGDPSSASGTGFCAGDFIEVPVTTKGGQVTALKALKGPQQNVLYLTYNADDKYDLWKYDGTDFINLTKTGSILKLISDLTGVVEGINSNVSSLSTRMTDIEGVANAAMPKAGGTFTGPVILPMENNYPTEDGHAVYKKYVDAQDAATLQAAKESAAGLYTTKDDFGDLQTTVNNNNTNIINNYLKKTDAPGYNNIMTKAGGTFTGAVTLSGAPTVNLHAATKKYVDEAKAAAIKNTSDYYATKTDLNTLTSNVNDLKTNIGSLSNIMNFVGVTTSALADVDDTTKPIVVNGSNYDQEIGDVVIYNATEFVWNGTKWEKIGNTSAETEALTDLDERVDKLEAKTANSSELVKAVDKNASNINALDSRLSQAELNINKHEGQLTWGTFTSLNN